MPRDTGLPPGTLMMLVLRVLMRQPLHGYAIAQRIRQVSADELTVPMRVLAVADVYEALTAERPYRHALTNEDALDLIRLDVLYRLDAEAFSALETVVY